ncbi:MAG TPA: hypothetical protein VKX28_01180 [Xanthobacteraceae bacterium]|nr:hypothetical protein [Xanthobacteraceae bacterium]
MSRRFFVLAILAVPLGGAAAQEMSETAQFTFQSTDSAPATKNQRFCLPAGQRLVRIDHVDVAQSNSASTVNITPDSSSPNCVMMTVQLPPAKKICSKIPVTTGIFQKMEFNDQCTTIPTSLVYTVHYTAAAGAH